MDKGKQLEPAIKAATLQYLIEKKRLDHGDIVINEFTLDSYSRRVDLVIANHNRLFGFEIKSAGDNLSRLEGQITTYLNYFDKVIVVSAPKHTENILKRVPQNVAVWENTDTALKIRQTGKIVPIRDPSKLIDMMTAKELFKLCNKLGINIEKKRSAAVEVLLSAAVCKLKYAVVKSLKDRYELAYRSFWKHIKDNPISDKDIEHLSPYRDERIAKKYNDEQKARFYSTLASQECLNTENLGACL